MANSKWIPLSLFLLIILSLLWYIFLPLEGRSPGFEVLRSTWPPRLLFIELIIYSIFLVTTTDILCWKVKWLIPLHALKNQLHQRIMLSKILSSISTIMIISALIPLPILILDSGDRNIQEIFPWLPLLILQALIALQITFLAIPTEQHRNWLSTTFYTTAVVCFSVLLQGILLKYSHIKLSKVFLKWPGIIPLEMTLILLAFVGVRRWFHGKKEERNFLYLVGLTLGGLMIIQWFSLPKSYGILKQYLAISMPLIGIGLSLCISSIQRNYQEFLGKWGINRKWFSLVIISLTLIVTSAIYIEATTKYAELINRYPQYGDQDDILRLAKEAYASNFRYVGDFNRTPIYLFLQAAFYKPGMTDYQFFTQGKMINIIISLIALGLMFGAFLLYFSAFQALVLTLIIAFSLYIFKAPFFQVEITYYLISFFSFLLMLQMLKRPTWMVALLTGAMTALGQLTKASLLPGFILFIGIYLAKGFFHWHDQKKHHQLSNWKEIIIYRIGLLVVALLSFFLLYYPYGRISQEKFGSFFYNVNSSIYMWYDNFHESWQAENTYHFREQKPDLPENEMPGPQKYLREHSLEQITTRLLQGIQTQIEFICFPYSLTNYPLSYFWVLLIVIMSDLRNFWIIARKNFPMLVFSVLYFLGYLIAFSWYSPIAPWPRFLYALLPPLLFSLFYALNQHVGLNNLNINEYRVHLDLKSYLKTIHLIMLCTLAFNIWVIFATDYMLLRYYGW